MSALSLYWHSALPPASHHTPSCSASFCGAARGPRVFRRPCVSPAPTVLTSVSGDVTHHSPICSGCALLHITLCAPGGCRAYENACHGLHSIDAPSQALSRVCRSTAPPAQPMDSLPYFRRTMDIAIDWMRYGCQKESPAFQ